MAGLTTDYDPITGPGALTALADPGWIDPTNRALSAVVRAARRLGVPDNVTYALVTAGYDGDDHP